MVYVKELDSTSDGEPINKWIGWICCIVPFYYRNTAGRDEGDSRAAKEPLRIAKPFLIQNQILSWNINFSKQTRVPMMDMDLTAGPVDLLKQAGAGDWIFFWAFTNKDDHDRILESLQEQIDNYRSPKVSRPEKALNDFNSGLKFVGRVHGVRRSRTATATGAINTRYFLTAVCMQEAETKIVMGSEARTAFSNQTDAAQNETEYLNAVFKNAKRLLSLTEKIITPKRLIEEAIKLFLGPGADPLGQISTDSMTPEARAEAELGKAASPNSSVEVPALVANMLGRGANANRQTAYFASIIGMRIGRELYNDPKVPVPSKTDNLKGSFIFQSDQIINKSVWEIIEECACQPLNEVYTAMRLTDGLRILPTITVRQVPQNDPPSPISTTFLSLPRWVVSSKMVISEDVGVSDANRYNYVWVHPVDPSAYGDQAVLSAARMLKQSPPVYDVANARRSGLRTMTAEFRLTDDGSNPADTQSYSGIAFNAIRNGHLKWNGRIVTVGIQEPISLGDNVAYDDVLYNINGMSHRGRITPSTGEKTFNTTIELASGVSLSGTEKRDRGSDFPDSKQPHGLDYTISDLSDPEEITED